MKENILPNPAKLDVVAQNSLDDICVAGITPFTTLDFPGRLAGVFYLQGCSWQCRYCYNTEFWALPPSGTRVPLEKIQHFLKARKGHLDGIVFSGGEPTMHERLPAWMQTIRDLGYEIGLHTAGMFPEKLEKVLPLCQWVGLDIKAPFRLYEKITQVAGSGEKARLSAAKILASGIEHEFRTTVHPALLSEDEILESGRELAVMGAKRYILQKFKAEHCEDKELRERIFPQTGISANLRMTLKNMFLDFQVRE